jgi:hypothetical protein
MGRPQTLLAVMTLEEKIGHLATAPADRTVTGPILPDDCEAAFARGRLAAC